MAPVCMACCPLSPLLTWFLLSLLFPFSHLLFVYDRQQLIDIYHAMPKLSGLHSTPKNYEFHSPPKQSSSFDYLYWRAPGVPRKRRHGKRGGAAVRLKLAWASGSPTSLLLALVLLDLVCRPRIPRCSVELGCSWICSTVLDSLPRITRWSSPRLRRRKANLCNLRSLCRASDTQHDPLQLKMGLANARSLANKTFICNDLISSNNLDIFQK